MAGEGGDDAEVEDASGERARKASRRAERAGGAEQEVHKERRQQHLDKQEEDGELVFRAIRNDASEHPMRCLVDLKNLYAKQLPNMPRDYIVRLVFDRQHISLIALKGGEQSGRLIAGCTYRPFFTQSLGEVAFCAVSAHEQVKGYGTRIMNKLKEYVTKHVPENERLTHLITFADNNAVGYFSKQGFRKEILLERERWSGYIKEYDGGTLMECPLDKSASIPPQPLSVLQEQISAVRQAIAHITPLGMHYDGLSAFQSKPDGEGRIDELHIPGINSLSTSVIRNDFEFKITLPGYGDGKPTHKNLHKLFSELTEICANHSDAWPFLEPVDPNEVPDYYDVIKDPIDLSRIRRRVHREDFYVNLYMFTADFARVFNNARTYNASDTPFYKAANRLERFFEEKLSCAIQFSNSKNTNT
jgi:histone acetyltransferase